MLFRSDLLLAFPGFAANGILNLQLNDKMNISPSLSWIGERYQVSGIDAAGESIYSKESPQWIGNLFVGLKHPKLKGMNVSLGCANVFDTPVTFIQPYNSNHAPYPGRSREFRISIRYLLDTSNKQEQ